MAMKQMTIPKKIHVGYNERKDTYTGKLAYVVYTDEKGKLRKEKSWKQWCSDNIKKDEFDNVPTEGFVLNKKVGDYRGHWDGRMAWIRIYDPRGFEFEITVANLLFILQECTSVKGKGLEGEFVYSWDRADLVLLPVSSQEYKSCKEFTNCKSLKVTKNDMIEGHVYQTKDMTEVIYMGRNDWFENTISSYQRNSKRGIVCAGKKHVFCRLTQPEKRNTWDRDKDVFYPEAGFTKLAKKISDKPHPEYADKYDAFKKTVNGSPGKEVKITKVKTPNLTITRNYYRDEQKCFFIIEDGKVYPILININSDIDTGNYIKSAREMKQGTVATKETPVYTYSYVQCKTPLDITGASFVMPSETIPRQNWYTSTSQRKIGNPITKEEIQKKQFCEVFILNEAGGKFKVEPNYWYHY